MPLTPLERVELGGLQDPGCAREFGERYVRSRRPVVLAGAAASWPALGAWRPAALCARFGSRRVPVIRRAPGGEFYDATAGVAYAPMAVSAFFEATAGGRRDLYMVFRVQEALPELLEDVLLPDFCKQAPWFLARFWAGVAGTGGPLHVDLPDNLYVQAVGRKRFYLAVPTALPLVGPYPPWSGVPNYARASIARPDFVRFPRLAGVAASFADLEPGDILYIPRLHWHQADAQTDSVSMNLWWARGPLHLMVRGAEAFQRLRKLSL